MGDQKQVDSKDAPYIAGYIVAAGDDGDQHNYIAGYTPTSLDSKHPSSPKWIVQRLSSQDFLLWMIFT